MTVGAKDNFVCCGPDLFAPLAFATRVCFVLSLPLGDASFPLELVGLRLDFVFLTMVNPRSFGTSLDMTARAGYWFAV